MTDASTHEFRLPGTRFFRLSTTATLGVGAIVSFSMIFKLGPDQYLSAIPIGLIVLLMVLGIVMARRELSKPRVCLDATTIRGYTRAGKELLLAWGEPVTVDRPGEANIYLRAAGGGSSGSLVIPVKIAMTPEFLAAVEKLAPAEHPLRKWMADETTGRNPGPYKPSKVPGIIGFGGGLATLFCLAKLTGRSLYIQPSALLLPFMVVFGVVVLSTLLNKQIQGPRWSNQHWFEKITTAVMKFTYGSFMSVIAFDIFMVITHIK
jgi:hypothetical protein